MVIGHFCGFGATRIDHDERAVWIGRYVAQNGAGALKAMGLPRVLADEHGNLSVLIASAETGPKEHMIHPELAGLFLGQSVGAEYRAKRAARRCSITADEMVSLPAAAVIENARATPSIANLDEAR